MSQIFSSLKMIIESGCKVDALLNIISCKWEVIIVFEYVSSLFRYVNNVLLI